MVSSRLSLLKWEQRLELNRSSCQIDFDVYQALNDRLQLLKPDILFAESMYNYNGKQYNISKRLDVSIKELQRSGKVEVIIVGPRDGLASETLVW